MKLIKEERGQRFYQFDFRITKHFGVGKEKTIKEMWEYDQIRFRDGYEFAEDVLESIDKICVSDAHTHTERLVFPAFNVRNKETGEVFVSTRLNQIDGTMTIMTHGGDHYTIHPDKVYVRHLRMLNRSQGKEG